VEQDERRFNAKPQKRKGRGVFFSNISQTKALSPFASWRFCFETPIPVRPSGSKRNERLAGLDQANR
jgi:hypothetical protein